MADGVGGFSNGEVASRLAVDTALDMFRQTPPELDPQGTLRRMFIAACARVHDSSLREHKGQTMATTLVATIVRNRVAHIAHVGDSRAYLIRKKKIFRLTKDHIATAISVKLGLILEREAMASAERCQLTRTVGMDPFCQPDLTTEFLEHGDFLLHCTDGLHAFVLDDEICELVSRHHPYDACRHLVALAEKRGCDDNISLQLLEVRDWEKVVKSTSKCPGTPVSLTHGGTGPGHDARRAL